ncbi:MAG: DUF4291 domain-containing protein [Deltaproteobacteria bacterium]|nr:DUF4291 domain-containing protein [Deltaproteobacteria bacterium]
MLRVEPYAAQVAVWPASGRHILAQYDDSTIVVYQAYRPSIADFAIAHQRFGGDFSFDRMSWVKPNFLWMMFRSAWATAEGQERVLALNVRRPVFDGWLRTSVSSSFDRKIFASKDAWQGAIAASEVRVQWDPDHDPIGKPIERRALQIGLRGSALAELAGPGLIAVRDVTNFVTEQRSRRGEKAFVGLLTPAERVYKASAEIAERLRLSPSEEGV